MTLFSFKFVPKIFTPLYILKLLNIPTLRLVTLCCRYGMTCLKPQDPKIIFSMLHTHTLTHYRAYVYRVNSFLNSISSQTHYILYICWLAYVSKVFFLSETHF